MNQQQNRWTVAALGLAALLAILAVGLGGCSSEQAPTSTAPAVQAPATRAARPKPVQEETREDVFGLQAQRFEYTYNPIGKKDPFRLDIERGQERFQGNSKLLQYNLGQLRVTAIIWGIAKPRALFQAPGGEGFIVQKGALVGRNYGKIDRILKNEVIVIEEYPGPNGKLIVNEIAMPLEDLGGDGLDLR